MRIYSQDTEIAYNNVVFNFPPSMIDLDISRNKILGFSECVDYNFLLYRLAYAANRALNDIVYTFSETPLVNIQEVARFIELLCVDLNTKNYNNKDIMKKLKNQKFLLAINVTDSEVIFCVKKDEGENKDIIQFFDENREHLDEIKKVLCNNKPLSLSDSFFRSFNLIMSKKRIASIEELDSIFIKEFNISNQIINNLKKMS